MPLDIEKLMKEADKKRAESKPESNGEQQPIKAATSKDVKPTPVVVGAKIKELNTGLKFIYDGANWIEDLTLYTAVKMALEDVV